MAPTVEQGLANAIELLEQFDRYSWEYDKEYCHSPFEKKVKNFIKEWKDKVQVDKTQPIMYGSWGIVPPVQDFMTSDFVGLDSDY